MSRARFVLTAALGFAVLNTTFLGIDILIGAHSAPQGVLTSGNPAPQSAVVLFFLPVFRFLLDYSLVLAPSSWVLLGGVWVTWRGRVRSRWEGLGFDSDVFKLFVKMRGGKSRLRMLNALTLPKDRYQLAQELDMDWRAVDQHLVALSRHKLVSEDVAYGKVRIYHLTPSGKLLLQLLEDVESDSEKASQISPIN